MNYQQPNTNSSMDLPDSVKNIGSNVESVTNQIQNSLSGFSDTAQANVDSAGENSMKFLQSNTLFAKLAFVVFIVIIFIFLLNLGINLLQYLFSPADNPYLVKGMVEGNANMTIPQNPSQDGSILIKRSNNESEGLEFTWSTWVFIDDLNTGDEYENFQHVFNKGNASFDMHGIADVSNGPGLYVKQKVSGNKEDPNTASFFIIMDTKTGRSNNAENSLEIKNIPIKKWVNVIIRMKNIIMEVYVNGVVSGRLQFREVPIQNYYDVHIGKNNGIAGKISNLRYFNEALSIFDITSIVSAGPNTKMITVRDKKMNNYNYLSNLWYTSKIY
jgi:hypothetical protein